MNIVIPSYKRSHRLLGKDYWLEAQYVVPESQAQEYREQVGVDRVIPIPDDQDGNIAKKRNWILKNVPRPLVMIDDDVRCLTMTEGGKNSKATQFIKLTYDEAKNVIINGFNLAQDWGCVLWGINVNTDGRNYQQYKPFSLTQVVLGPFMAHLDHDLLYDERMGTKDDYDFSLQVLQRHKKILRMNKYSYDCDHGDNEGGIVSMRTMDREIGYCRAIERKWGRKVISYPLEPKKRSELLNGRVNVPIAGV